MARVHFTLPTPDWSPFRVERNILIAPRPITAPGFKGVGDRLRTAAFAEVQAEAAFLWATQNYPDAQPELRESWRLLANEEKKHLHWLLGRMQELSIDIAERPVSDILWHSLTRCQNAREFCHHMAGAEERGCRAGERFAQTILRVDPESARVFGQIAVEEKSHIELAYRFFPLERKA
ncbi:MAG: DUF455 family protein [Bdellovibrionota bacterium]